MENMQNSQRIKSIDKALDVLEFLSNNGDEIGISDISRGIGMGLSTAHRITNTLKSRGYIIQNQKTLKYRLSIKLFELGCEVQNAKNLIRIARPYLKKLSRTTNETTNLAILEEKKVVYLETVESLEILKTGIYRGAKLPAHCTALGKVLLAYLTNEEFNRLYKKGKELETMTFKSITSLDELKMEIKKIKEKEYAIDMEEFMEGVHCLAVPVFGRDNEVIAAMSITGPSTRLTASRIKEDIPVLKKVSKNISRVYTM